MIAYSSEELIPITDLSKKFISYLAQLQAQTVDKIAILQNNHIEAVVISKEKYENMQKALDLQYNQRVTNDLLLEFQEISKNISSVDKNIDILSMDKDVNNDIF